MADPENVKSPTCSSAALVILVIAVLIGYSTFQSSFGAGPSNFGGTIVGHLMLIAGPVLAGLLAIVGLVRDESPKWVSIVAMIGSVVVFLCRSWILAPT